MVKPPPTQFWFLLTEAEVEAVARGEVPSSVQEAARRALLPLAELVWAIKQEEPTQPVREKSG